MKFKCHITVTFLTRGQISKSSKHSCGIYQKKGMDETNSFVLISVKILLSEAGNED